MNQTNLCVEDNMVVSVAYVLSPAPRSGAPRTEKQKSMQVVQGRRQLVPGLERALYGMSAGEEKDVVVAPTEGFGEVDPGAVKTLPRNSVPSFAQAAPGQRMRLLHKASGEMRRATVVDVQPDTVVLDFNHPLAGKTLYYHVRVDDLRPATPAELESGQAQATSVS